MKRSLTRLVLAMLLLPLVISAACAHAVLIDADPRDGGVYSALPEQARLRFNEPVTPVVVRLLTPDGSSRVLQPRATDNDITAPLPDTLGDGTYVLSYRVISLDSHPVAGSLVFARGASAPVSPAAKTNGTPHWEAAFPFVHGVALIALFLAIGGAVLCGFVLPDEAHATRAVACRTVPVGAVIGAITALVSVGIRGAGLADSPPAELFTATPWRIALSTAMGTGLALIIASSACAIAATRTRAAGERVLALAAVGLLAWGLATTSHAALAPPMALSFPAYLIHVVVAAFWLGSLPLLAAALAREPLPLARSVVAVFSQFAVWAVGALIVAGFALTAVQSGPDLSVWLGPAWRDTIYGGTLAAKIAAALIVVAIAVRNKRTLTPLLAKADAGARRLRRSIAWEGATMVVVIGLAAVLASAEPPRSTSALGSIHDAHAANPESGAVIEANRDGVQILLEVDPATPGPNELIVHFFDAAKGEHLFPKEVTVAVSLPAGGVEPLRRPALPKGDGTYRVEGMPLPAAGSWEVRIEALLTDFDKLIVTMELPLE